MRRLLSISSLNAGILQTQIIDRSKQSRLEIQHTSSFWVTLGEPSESKTSSANDINDNKDWRRAVPAAEEWCFPARRTRCSVWVWCASWGLFQKLAAPASGWSVTKDCGFCPSTSAHTVWWVWVAHTGTWPQQSSLEHWVGNLSELGDCRYIGMDPSHLIVPGKSWKARM